jgi:hypothetical protein
MVWRIATFQLAMQEVLNNYIILTVMFYEPVLESVKIHVCFTLWDYGNGGGGYTLNVYIFDFS